MVNHKILIDFDHPTTNKVLVKQGDNWSRSLEFIFIVNGKKVSLKKSDEEAGVLGDIVAIRATTPSGAKTFANCEVTDDGTAIYILTENLLAEVGRVNAEVTWTTVDNETINSFDIQIIVENLLFNENEYVSDDDLQGVKEYMIRASQAAQKAEAEADEAEGFAAEASDSADAAAASATEAYEVVAGTAELVEQAKAEADRSEEEANRSKGFADLAEGLSKSWAVGGTGLREDEDTNNSMFFANRSEVFASNAEKSERYVDEQIAQMNKKLGATNFEVNLEDGHLYYDNDAAYVFQVAANGHLEWGIA